MRKAMQAVLLLGAATLAGCRQPDLVRPPAPGPEEGSQQIFVATDPEGATVTIDGQETGQTTPDTVRRIPSGPHSLGVSAVRDGVPYGYDITLNFGSDAPASITLPLLARCADPNCLAFISKLHEAAGLRFTTDPAGMPFYLTGATAGLLWPASSTNGYSAGAAAIFAARPAPDSAPVSAGVYTFNGQFPTSYWLGRPATGESSDGGALVVRRTTWISPSPYFVNQSTLRGIAVDQTITGRSDLDGALLVHLVFRNITASASYRQFDRVVPAGGITYTQAYIGFGMDADVGEADDDQVSYAPGMNLVYTYDSDFFELGFDADSTRPALVGLRLLRGPAGVGDMVLNSWPLKIGAHALDWFAGNQNEAFGWEMMSGTQTLLPDNTSPSVGYVPDQPNDYRMSLSVGPLTLAPGDSAALDVALVVAYPAAGTYTPHDVLAPGDPFDAGRPLAAVAAPLLQRARDAERLLPP